MLPSAWATASSRNNSLAFLCRTEKPSRHAFCASAQASQLLPMPVGPRNTTVEFLAHPFAVGQGTQELTIQPAGVLVVGIFDHGALFQLGRAQATPQGPCPILFPQPLVIDQQGEALFETELVRLGDF